MSIRTRLTLLFAAIAAFAVLLAAIVGYRSTADRVVAELDVSLRNGAARGALGPNCLRPADFPGRGERRSFELGEARAQCVDGLGKVVTSIGSNDDGGAFPLDIVDRELLKSRSEQLAPSVVEQAGDPSDPTSEPGDGQTRGRGQGRNRGREALTRPGELAEAVRKVRIRTVEQGDDVYRVASAAMPGGGLFMLGRDLGESSRVLDGLRWRFAGIGGLVVLCSAVVGALAARALSKPLRALTGVSESIAEHGALADSTNVDPFLTKRPDELGRLAKSFSSMLASLRSSRSQQQQLAQDAGHELRTPLTSLRTNVDVLAKYPDLDPIKRAAVLQEMDAELRELSTLTDELLVLATDSTPDDPIVASDLGELTRRAISRMERRTGRIVRAQIDTSPFEGRRIQLSRAIDNVLANAAKFDPTSEPIEVTVTGGVLTVRDHGPGFAANDVAHVFDRFYRSDSARQLPGTGLGLAIVADAAKAHGGTVTASNHPQGGGVVTLTVSLPT
jgi:two-component system, OmpR family, sensor histidine kinase MprB